MITSEIYFSIFSFYDFRHYFGKLTMRNHPTQTYFIQIGRLSIWWQSANLNDERYGNRNVCDLNDDTSATDSSATDEQNLLLNNLCGISSRIWHWQPIVISRSVHVAVLIFTQLSFWYQISQTAVGPLLWSRFFSHFCIPDRIMPCSGESSRMNEILRIKFELYFH